MEKKTLITSKGTHNYPYKSPNTLTLSIQKIISWTTKKYFEDITKNAIIIRKDGKKAYDLTIYTRFQWLYRGILFLGSLINKLPKKLTQSLLHKFKKYGIDFSLITMTTVPQERFKHHSSFIFLPDSKENEIKTSEGKMVLPHLLVIEMLKRVCAYDPEHSIAKGHYCVCRKTRNCKNYPQDEISCIIIGPGATDVVERGMGNYLSLDKAIKLIKTEVMPRRLSSFISPFPVDLHYYWGVKSHHSKFTFEVCFCCTCCCILKRPQFFIPNEPIEGRGPFIDVRGFKAKIDLKKCNGMGKCVKECPLHRIKLVDVLAKDGKIVKKATNKDCIGCGTCVPYCPNNAIEIVATESFDHLEDLLGIFEYYKLEKEEFLVKLNKKYREINKKLI
jgi:NAD-dependent dihydropyrimidine dehydrogenase PreA subunit